MTSASSKLDYLKKYMSEGNESEERRKKRKKTVNPKAVSGIIVVDNEIQVHKVKSVGITEDDPYHDNGPTVAEIVDESIPRGMQDSKKWRSIVSHESETRGQGSGRRSPVVVRRESPDSDLSPPRLPAGASQSKSKIPMKSGTRHESQQSSSRFHDNDSDLSPERGDLVRRRARSGRDSPDISAPSRQSHSTTKKSGRDRRKSPSKDLSPLRTSGQERASRNSRSDSDLSPERTGSVHPPKDHAASGSNSSALPKKTLSGMSAGLQSARTLREEADQKRRREEASFRAMDTDISGRNAETVYRNRKTGKRRDMDAEAEIEAEKAAKKKIHDDKFKKWGKGLVQGGQQEASVNDALHEMSKPLARYADDSDRDALLKAVDREGDPMLEYLKSKKAKVQGDAGRPKYKGPPAAPNRYAIPPGYRWDGVDRSNGFEKNRFTRMSNRTATTEQAYKWSTEDM